MKYRSLAARSRDVSPACLSLFAVLVLAAAFHPAQLRAQSSARPSLPTVNLGETSFLDAIAQPGWMLEEYGQGLHDDRTISAAGTLESGTQTVNSGSGLSHVAWISPHKILGAWYGAEVLVPVAYVDAKSGGQQGGVGDMTLGPVLLQWPRKKLLGGDFYQRVLLDFEIPTGAYSTSSGALNIGANAWTVHPYYAFTWMPAKKLETSWRISYLWNATNNDPVHADAVHSTQAGQAVHFNATLGYDLGHGVYLGANGYFLHQLTDARVNDIAQSGTEQVGALGPGVVVHRGSYFYYANLYREFGAVDRAEGNKLVLRIEKTF